MGRRFDLLAVSALVATSLVAPAASFHDEGGTVSGGGCPTGRWPFTTSGRPVDFRLGEGVRAALWREDQAWRLRFTATGRARSFRGTVRAAEGFSGVRAVKVEGADRVTLDGDGVGFSLRTAAHVDGLNFRPGCSRWVELRVSVDGSRLRPARILVGRLGNAHDNPLRVTRLG